MNKEELETKHESYADHIDDWELFSLVYESGHPLIKKVLYKQPRETPANYAARLQDAYVINFAQAVVDIYNFYLTQKDVNRAIEGLDYEPLWKMFLEDSDLMGTNYDDFLSEAQKLSSITGAVGVLVNRGGSAGKVVKDDIERGVYPYCCLYTPQNIYDWKFERDPVTHRYQLVYLKLYEGNGLYLIWYLDRWEMWEIQKVGAPKVIERKPNILGEIPFLWMYNLKKIGRVPFGESDIKDISRITISIVQNCSSAEEVIKYAGFPIMREPMEEEGALKNDESIVGVTAVKEFDPTLGPHAKPDWMPTEILEPIDAILKWIDRKVEEIYRICHLSGAFGQRTGQVSTGLALRYQFTQLNTMLIKKSINMTEADEEIIRLWMKWQGISGVVKVIRSREFSIDELSVMLDNIITTMKNVLSKTYRQRIQEKMVRSTLPELDANDLKQIRIEIESNTPETAKELAGPEWPTNTKKDVRPADQAIADHSREDL
jgi:hypothetical protein